jgi:hypothetical protein
VKNPLAAHPPWRQIVIVSIALPIVIVGAVLAFTWPAARIAPRNLPIGVVGTSAATQRTMQALRLAEPGAFDLHVYADEASAHAAIEHRDVYGAFVVGSKQLTVLEASAASPSVAQLLSTVGAQLARGSASTFASADIVPTSATDPHGLVLSSAVLPLTICSIIIAAIAAVVVGLRPAWRQVLALAVVSTVAGAGTFLIAQVFLGALPHDGLASSASLALMLFAISSTTAGLVALIGPAGLGISAVLMVFVGNPFSGVTSAPQMLPGAADHLGQWLPPGAGANLLRSTAYFGGDGGAPHLTVLALWAAAGVTAIIVGHHTSARFAASSARASSRRAAAQGESAVSVARLRGNRGHDVAEPASLAAAGGAFNAARTSHGTGPQRAAQSGESRAS